jgi:hypothetical protein
MTLQWLNNWDAELYEVRYKVYKLKFQTWVDVSAAVTPNNCWNPALK